MKKLPYTTPSGLQIGINYHPKANYHNPDQDWLQALLLGIKPSFSTQACASYAYIILFFYVFLAVMFRGAPNV
jgi:hypothetical protein